MAEPIGLASGIVTLATFALQSSVSLYKTVDSFCPHPKRVRDLLGELEALNDVLALLVDLAQSKSDINLSLLHLPLLRCGDVCKGFQQEVLKCITRSNDNWRSIRNWAELTYQGDNIDNVRNLLASYRTTINIAITDANLRLSAAAVTNIEDYERLIQHAKADLGARLEGIDNKLESLTGKDENQPGLASADLRSLREERLSTENCLQICAEMSSHIDQIHLMANKPGAHSALGGVDYSRESVTTGGPQEHKSIWRVSAATDAVTTLMAASLSSDTLYQTVKNLKSRPTGLRELLRELDALQEVLQALEDLIGRLNFDLTFLQIPLMRCNNACRDFDALIKRSTSHSTEERSSITEWLKLGYLGGDISDFRNMLAGYKSTFSIALAYANLYTTKTTKRVYDDFIDLIENTKCDLENHLRRIVALQNSATSSTERDKLQMMEDEKCSTQKGLDICDQSLALIDQSQSRSLGLEEQFPKPFSHTSPSTAQKLFGLANSGGLDSVQKEDLNQGRLEEAEQVGMQAMETRSQVLGLEHSNAPNLTSDGLVHDTHVGFAYSDSSSDNNSVFSDPLSIPSTSSLEPGIEEMSFLLIQQFTNLLNEDGVVILLLSTGVSKKRIGFQRMRNKFRRLLKQFATNLEADIISDPHRDLKRFVSSYSAVITRKLFAIAHIDESQSNKPQFLDAEHGLTSVEKRQAQENKVELYLKSLHSGSTTHATEVNKGLNPDDEESDQDSVAEEFGVAEPYEGSLQTLDQMKHFILGSSAYQILIRQLEEFVQPTLDSQFRDILTRWSKPEHKNHGDIDRYKLRNLVTELQHMNPFDIKFEQDEDSPRLVRSINSFQHIIERWTGELWEWWPLPRCRRPLSESETRLRWKCMCGEDRWAEVPDTLAKRLQSIIRSLPIDTSTTSVTDPPPGAYNKSSPNYDSTLKKSQNTNQVSFQDNGRRQPRQTPTNPSLHHPSSGSESTIAAISSTRPHVLFLAKHGGEYRLSQISVGDMNCNSFFSTMKKEYFRLRGHLRSWFSIWRYSHCDFYKFEKFDDYEFTLRIKDSFPEDTNTDYEYQPRPMDNIPPISEHEFTKRFYACHKFRQPFHLHHQCKTLGAHSSDILKFLPKKKTRLEEAGDKREDFWGIYAREMISLRWIIFYNFVCVSPLLAFFLAWIVPRGLRTDLQNPTIPLSIMISMLSLFWSVFLGSLQFGRPH